MLVLLYQLVKHEEAMTMKKMEVTLHCLKLTWEENIKELLYLLIFGSILYCYVP